MTQSNGQREAPICSKCWKNLDSSQKIRRRSLPVRQQDDRAQYLQRHPCCLVEKIAPLCRRPIEITKQSGKHEPGDGPSHDSFAGPLVYVLPGHFSPCVRGAARSTGSVFYWGGIFIA